jgi:hypothetical protein
MIAKGGQRHSNRSRIMIALLTIFIFIAALFALNMVDTGRPD